MHVLCCWYTCFFFHFQLCLWVCGCVSSLRSCLDAMSVHPVFAVTSVCSCLCLWNVCFSFVYCVYLTYDCFTVPGAGGEVHHRRRLLSRSSIGRRFRGPPDDLVEKHVGMTWVNYFFVRVGFLPEIGGNRGGKVAGDKMGYLGASVRPPSVFSAERNFFIVHCVWAIATFVDSAFVWLIRRLPRYCGRGYHLRVGRTSTVFSCF